MLGPAFRVARVRRRTAHPLRSLLVVWAALVAASCDRVDEQAVTPRSEVRDSAGVVIVENEAADPISRLPWELSPEPQLSIGQLDGAAEYQLFRVEDALRLRDGRILIANGGSSEIRVFDAAGSYIDAWGRQGEGPGEFTGLADLAIWPGDSIMSWDFGQNRLTLFASDGSLGRTQRLPLGDDLGAGRFEGILPDGSILTASLVSFDVGDRTTGLVRRSREYVRVDAAGAPLNSFGRYDDEEYYVRAELMAIMRHPFRRSVHSAIWGDRVVISPSDLYEIRAYDPSGALEIIVRRDYDLVDVTQTDLDRLLDARLADAEPSARPTLVDLFEGMPTVESFPAFSQLLVDSSGDLWVKDYVAPGVDQSVWTVFAPDGRIRGLFETPRGLRVYRIGSDYVLGLMTDEFEVEYVQLWSLDRVGY